MVKQPTDNFPVTGRNLLRSGGDDFFARASECTWGFPHFIYIHMTMPVPARRNGVDFLRRFRRHPKGGTTCVRKIYYFKPEGKTAPFLGFMDSLDSKARQKIIYALQCMAISPGKLSEPQVKHFSIERYKRLYELREKSRVLVRIIFIPDAAGNIILLHPFLKQHKRNTYQALETSLGMLEQIHQNKDSLREYSLSGRSQT